MESVSPYAVITAALMFVIIIGFLWICRDAMRSGMTFEGEIKNRMLSMKIRTNPPHPPPANADPPPDSQAGREEEAA